MRSTIAILLVIILGQLSVCAQDYSFTPKYSTVIDSSFGTLMLDQCSRYSPRDIKDFWNPSSIEISSVENNFKKILGLTSNICCCTDCKISNLDEFGFQYIGIIIKKKKYIYINAFRYGSESKLNSYYSTWKTKPVKICDGGGSFWGALFDIEQRKFSQLAFNGYA